MPGFDKPFASRLLAALALASGFGCAQAQDARNDAMQAAVADGVSSAAVLMTSAASINPLVPLVAVGMKAATFEYTSRLPANEQPAAYGAAKAMWAGGAVNNVCMAASFLSGGGFIPACIALGFAWGVQSWKEDERQRQSRTDCSLLREFLYEVGNECAGTWAGRATSQPVAAMITAQDLVAP